MKYQGSCHCKSVQFEFEAKEIESALQCNCSICIRKNAIMSKTYIEPAKFSLTQGKDALSTYQWGDKDVNHHFCKYCGIHPFHDLVDQPGAYRVNLGCVEGIEPRRLAIFEFNGRDEL
ncbi:GFA family protein [Aliikangiella sp. G2MR2-5]|uniref:GFA family protein n=1 Tax=Aliikangiella sp. G2MR2-5 TaxID=2788943 RepID=UPI0018ABAA07|nr:GFA family protein [Aliikangiella sp. G2MR2-5]